ncbi:hypothetical protein GLOIN_2v1789033 [Rhizophagus clarus]|uniref:Uncharacterized protein n=1 Tax=Rhizophagus clarus TaxID=94130 RepID=A0A8H3L235_9GLOM|nr:hypothetical protein GLOIN_2v1789033 [Rhizophagus clarus]
MDEAKPTSIDTSKPEEKLSEADSGLKVENGGEKLKKDLILQQQLKQLLRKNKRLKRKKKRKKLQRN